MTITEEIGVRYSPAYGARLRTCSVRLSAVSDFRHFLIQ